MKLTSYFFTNFLWECQKAVSDPQFSPQLLRHQFHHHHMLLLWLFLLFWIFNFNFSWLRLFNRELIPTFLLCSESPIWASCSHKLWLCPDQAKNSWTGHELSLTNSPRSIFWLQLLQEKPFPILRLRPAILFSPGILPPLVVAASSKNLFLRLFYSACIIQFWLVSSLVIVKLLLSCYGKYDMQSWLRTYEAESE